MRKLLGITTAALLLALTGCGGADDVSSDENTASASDSTDTTTDTTEPTESTESTDSAASGDYCDELKLAKQNFSDLTGNSLNEDTYNQMVDELRRIADVAPADVQGDWQRVTDALTQLHDLLATAGITFDDLQAMSAGQVPPDVDLNKLQSLQKKLTKISTDLTTSASSTNIQKSAQQDCGLTFN